MHRGKRNLVILFKKMSFVRMRKALTPYAKYYWLARVYYHKGQQAQMQGKEIKSYLYYGAANATLKKGAKVCRARMYDGEYADRMVRLSKAITKDLLKTLFEPEPRHRR